MGQKVNPISNRLGIIRGWDSKRLGLKLVRRKELRGQPRRGYEDPQIPERTFG